MDWINKRCDSCIYAIDKRCRRFPPKDEFYPTVIWNRFMGEDFQPEVIPMQACSEYKSLT